MFMIRVPEVTFQIRQKTDEMPGFEWRKMTTRDIFAGRRVVVFAVPGAFTPTCSSTHLPGYEGAHEKICAYGVDDVYCVGVTDSFVMNNWFSSQGVDKVRAIPDGAGEFTRKMGFLIDKSNQGMGMRSWRYSMVVTDGVVEYIFVEPGMADNTDEDPFVVSDADTMLQYLEYYKQAQEQSETQKSEPKPAASASVGLAKPAS